MTSALIEIRLSNETEESTSPERHREQDTRYCEMRGSDMAHIAEDLDVSQAIAVRPARDEVRPIHVVSRGSLSA